MTEKRRIKYFIVNNRVQLQFLFTSFITIIPIIALYFHINTRNEIIENFNKNKILTCTTKDLILDVSKEDNYILDEFYFIKDKTKIPVLKCEVKD
jgi:hypothetical protein